VPVPWIPRTTLRLFLLLGIAGCGAAWRRAEPSPSGPLPRRQQVQVWTGGRVLRLHGVVVRADTVSGVPFLESLDCDSCRVGIGRAEIDSLRIGEPVNGFWKTAALGAVVGLIAMCRAGWCEAGGT
jgi:hypothetical protein